MAIDLREPQGKYGGSFNALAGILQQIQQAQKQSRARQFFDTLSEGIKNNESPFDIAANFRPKTGGFFNRLLNPRAPSGIPGATEQNLLSSLVGQRIKDPRGILAQQQEAELGLIKSRGAYFNAAAKGGISRSGKDPEDIKQSKIAVLLKNRAALLEEVTVKDENGIEHTVPRIQAGMEGLYNTLTRQIIQLGDAPQAEKFNAIAPAPTQNVPVRGEASGKQKSPYPQWPDAFLENGVWKVRKDGVKYRIEP